MQSIVRDVLGRNAEIIDPAVERSVGTDVALEAAADITAAATRTADAAAVNSSGQPGSGIPLATAAVRRGVETAKFSQLIVVNRAGEEPVAASPHQTSAAVEDVDRTKTRIINAAIDAESVPAEIQRNIDASASIPCWSTRHISKIAIGGKRHAVREARRGHCANHDQACRREEIFLHFDFDPFPAARIQPR